MPKANNGRTAEAEAKKIVLREHPKAFISQSGGTYRVFSGEAVAPIIASGKTSAEAWERAAVEVKYANGED